MRKILAGVAFCFIMAYQAVCHSGAEVEKIGGVNTGVNSTTYTSHNGAVWVKEALIFRAYDFSGTAVYNNAGETAETSGWIDVQDYNDAIIFHVNLATLGSTGIKFTFQALLSDDTATPVNIFIKSFSTTDTGYSLPLAEGALKYIRVKGESTGTDSTDACTISMRSEGKRK